MIIYVVDDQGADAIRMAFSFKKDIKVVEFRNPEDALSALGGEHPNLIFLDYEMPEMNGLDFLDMIRSKWIDIPVVFMSGAPNRVELSREALLKGASAFIAKPFTAQDIFAAFNAYAK